MTFDQFGSAGFMINLCARLISQRMTIALSPLGVSTAYLPILFDLSSGGASTQRELAERVSIEQPTMARTLSRMERDGLITRVSDEGDRRRAVVALTDRAKTILPEVEAIATAINNKIVEGLGINDDELFIKLVSLAVENLRDGEAIAQAAEEAAAEVRAMNGPASSTIAPEHER